jgi:HAD superfamily hydrolase (TIGR01509 family)
VSHRPGAVIFDCDGVLVDSETLMSVIFSDMLTELGLPYTPDDTIRTFMGRSMVSCMHIVEQQLGHAAPEDFLQRLDVRAYDAFERDLEAVPGVTRLLDLLDVHGIPYAVASSGSHDKMHKTLGLTGLLPRLEGRITSATEVAHGKPSPDVFLLAAERLEMPAAECLVIEDSLLGVEAALAAGMRVIGYAAMTDASAMRGAGATHVVTTMDEISALLAL